MSWTVDGSGPLDVQQHYLTLPKDGRVVAAGAHIHNGGRYADLVDDRGRTLCRSTLALGDEPVLVVGAGLVGAEIAASLHETGRDVVLL